MASKYRNIKEKFDGVTFHSKKEANRYRELKLLLLSNHISELTLQPKFKIIINNCKICTYIADFMYVQKGIKIVEDVKGHQTVVFKLKAKLFKALYPQYQFILT